MSDDEDHSKDLWSLLQHYGYRELVSDPLGSPHRPQTTAPKRPEEHESETGSEPSPPAAESSKRGETPSSDHPHLARSLAETAPSLPHLLLQPSSPGTITTS